MNSFSVHNNVISGYFFSIKLFKIYTQSLLSKTGQKTVFVHLFPLLDDWLGLEFLRREASLGRVKVEAGDGGEGEVHLGHAEPVDPLLGTVPGAAQVSGLHLEVDLGVILGPRAGGVSLMNDTSIFYVVLWTKICLHE